MDAERSLEHVRARLVAALTRRFGADRAELVEDAVQDALVSALRTRMLSHAEGEVSAWLYRTARNRAIDILRRDSRSADLPDVAIHPHDAVAHPVAPDGELRVLLQCCHPALSISARVALSLSVAAGLTAPQIAAALLVPEPTLRQTLVRAKRRLRERRVDLALPTTDIEVRLDAALETLYLMFNEGYGSFDGDDLVRPELCHEAMRLCGLLLDSRLTAKPRVCALGALLFLQGARLAGRTDGAGHAVRLADQDRTTWDRRLLAVGFSLLERSAAGHELSAYHLEAEIASHHARATSVQDTDWASIVRAYDLLLELQPSPVVRLNRAVALGELHGAPAALAVLEELGTETALDRYPFFHTTLGHYLARTGRGAESRRAYERALVLATSRPTRAFVVSLLGEDGMSKNDGLVRLE